jgi:hypothetical protein
MWDGIVVIFEVGLAILRMCEEELFNQTDIVELTTFIRERTLDIRDPNVLLKHVLSFFFSFSLFAFCFCFSLFVFAFCFSLFAVAFRFSLSLSLSLFGFHFSLFAFHFSLFTFRFSLFTFRFSLFAFRFSLLAFSFLCL